MITYKLLKGSRFSKGVYRYQIENSKGNVINGIKYCDNRKLCKAMVLAELKESNNKPIAKGHYELRKQID